MRLILSLWLLLDSTVASITLSMLEGGSQYIYYDGVISGHYGADAGHCGDKANTYYFTNHTSSTLYIGVNPPWDTNPLFFYLMHDGRDYHTTNNTGVHDRCLNVFSGYCTNDAIYNLGLASTYYVCFKNGQPCGIIEFWPWYYVAAPMYNLSTASIVRVPSTNHPVFGNDMYYSVSGDNRTWVSNGTVQNAGLGVQLPMNYSSSEEDAFGSCGNDYSVHWTSLYSSYSINFTNTTVQAAFTVSDDKRNLTMFFDGKRVDGLNETSSPQDINGNYSAIALASPENHTLPHFTYANGKEIYFRQDSEAKWHSSFSAGMPRYRQAAKAAWIALVLTVVFVLC